MKSHGFDFDLFVIGAGSGGVRASRVAARYGARVAVAESSRIGGTCVNLGCVPKKLFVYASHFRDDFEDAAGFGWSVDPPRFDWTQLLASKDREIARLNKIYKGLLDGAGVTLFESRARLVDRGDVLAGLLAGAAAAYDRALTIYTELLGPDSLSVAETVNNVGMVKLQEGDLEGAEAAFVRSLAGYERSVGGDHPRLGFPLRRY